MYNSIFDKTTKKFLRASRWDTNFDPLTEVLVVTENPPNEDSRWDDSDSWRDPTALELADDQTAIALNERQASINEILNNKILRRLFKAQSLIIQEELQAIKNGNPLLPRTIAELETALAQKILTGEAD